MNFPPTKQAQGLQSLLLLLTLCLSRCRGSVIPRKQVLYLDRDQKTQTQIQKGSKLAKEPQGGERGECNHTRTILSIDAIDDAARVKKVKYYFCLRFFSFLVGGRLAGQRTGGWAT